MLSIRPIGHLRKIYRSLYNVRVGNLKNEHNRIINLREYALIDYKVKERRFLKNEEIQDCLDVRQNKLVDSGCLNKKILKKYSADSILEVGEKTLKNKKTGEVITIPFFKYLELE